MDSTDRDTIELLQGMLSDSYEYAMRYFERKDFIQRMMDGDVYDSEWSTMSEVHIPLLRSIVKSAVPDAMQYMFPVSGFVSLIPNQGGMTRDDVERFEHSLDNLLLRKMLVQKHAVPIIQDGIKFGAGYGIVEKAMYYKDNTNLYEAINGGRLVKAKRKMEISSLPVIYPRLRYINYEQIVPYPDGDSPDTTSCTMFIDYYREDEFRDLYASNPVDDPIYKGDPDAIIKETLDLGIGGGMYPHFWNMMVLGGESTQSMQAKYRKIHEIAAKRRTAKSRLAPVIIPVVKYYMKREHIWVANGRTIIYRDKGGYETLRCPILKASPDTDSNNWWAMSDVAASSDMHLGINAYHNAVLDLMTQYLRPVTVYDSTRWGGREPPKHEPWATHAFAGKINDAYDIKTPPPVAPGLLNMGDNMQMRYLQVNGEPLDGQSSPGLLRGGSHAFETLLQTQNGRREFAGFMFDMGFIEPLVKNTIIHMQTLPQNDYEYIELKDRDYVASRINLDEIRYSFDVNLDLREKIRNSISEKMANIALYNQVYRDNPRIRQVEALEDVIMDSDKARRLIASDEEYQKQMRDMMAMSGGAERSGQSEAEQSVSGGLGRMSA